MTAPHIIRLIWLAVTLIGMTASFWTLHRTFQDYFTAQKDETTADTYEMQQDYRDMLLVAGILLRDKLVTVFAQLGFVAIIISAINDPPAAPNRGIILVMISGALAINSMCRVIDRKKFDEMRESHRERIRHRTQKEEEGP